MWPARTLGLLLALAPVGRAGADPPDPPTESGIVERSHRVDIRFVDGAAHLTVRREWVNLGSTPASASLTIAPPPGAAASGLRLRTRGAWVVGTLGDAGAARDRYVLLHRPGAAKATTLGLLEWSGALLELALFPLQAATVTVEYTLIAPVDYRDGRYVLRYPIEAEATAPTLRIDPASVGGGATIDGKVARRGATIVATRTPADPDALDDSGSFEATDTAEVTIAPPPIHLFKGRLGRAVVGPDATILRLELDAATKLGRAPRGASVVFVVDVSWSETEAEIERQLEIIRAYARLLPDAKIELVAFHRRAQRVFGRFVPAAELDQALADLGARARLRQGNGSALEEGLAVAATLLRGRSGPKRIVALTDALLRGRFTAAIGEEASRRAPPDAILHVVLPALDDPPFGLRRDDAHPLASVAASRGGVLFHAEEEGAASTQISLLGLVRPVSIDNLAIEANPTAPAIATPPLLREGGGHRGMQTLADGPSSIVVTGVLWQAPVRLHLQTTPPFDQATAAFAAVDPPGFSTADDIRTLAVAAGVVSRETSLLAAADDAAPSVLGRAAALPGKGGGGGYGHGHPPNGSVAFSPRSRANDTNLALAVYGAIEACSELHDPYSTWALPFQIETTFQEIVDVLPSREPANAMDRCVIDAIWALRIVWPVSAKRRMYTFDLPPLPRRRLRP